MLKNEKKNMYNYLYDCSINGNNFKNIYRYIISEENIDKSIKYISEKSFFNKYIDKKTLLEIEVNNNVIVELLKFYKPEKSKKIYMESKYCLDTSIYGISNTYDLIIEQMLLQVLDPIFEGKFHNHSYYSRPNRYHWHALARVVSLINVAKKYTAFTINLESIVEKIDHNKIIEILYSNGIKDKKTISIIKSILDKNGSKYGISHLAILKSLFINIILNDLDWFISNQWETFKPKKAKNKNGSFNQYASQYTKLKSGFFVRYGFNLILLSKSYNECIRFKYSILNFIKKRYGLHLDEDSILIKNLKQNSIDFIGFNIKVVKNGKSRHGFVAKTKLSNTSKDRILKKLLVLVKDVYKKRSWKNALKINSFIEDIHYYYKFASCVYLDLTDINFHFYKAMKRKFKDFSEIKQYSFVKKKYKKTYKGICDTSKIFIVKGVPITPLTSVSHKSPMNFSQNENFYKIEK